jgi:hypothetical protein
LSEPARFSTGEIRKWLQEQTDATLTPIHVQAKRLRDDLNMSIQSVADVSKALLDNSAKEIERRNERVYNRARALNKLARLFLDRLKKLGPPDEITYENLTKFAQDTQKVFLVTDIDIKSWFPRLSPFFIMDRRRFLSVHEKAKLSLSTLNDFLTKEYVKTKTLEETFQLIDELQNLEKQQVEIEREKASLREERIPIEKEIAIIEQRIAHFQSEGPVEQLLTLEAEIEKLNNELKYLLRHLQKPFIKVQALSLHGGGSGLTQDEVGKLNQYLEKPFNALASENEGYPLLKQILQKLSRLIAEDKLKLKPDKARKAEQALNDILKGDILDAMYSRCAEAATWQKQLLNSPKMEEVKRDITALQEQLAHLKTRKASVESHEAVKEREYGETQERINSTKRNIEKNVLTSLNKKIQVL